MDKKTLWEYKNVSQSIKPSARAEQLSYTHRVETIIRCYVTTGGFFVALSFFVTGISVRFRFRTLPPVGCYVPFYQ